jgi:glucose-1-phosphate adenylyltransferase
MNDIITLILAGGQGSRLYPLTKIRAKPAVPIAGQFRLIDVPISNCIHSGLRKIYILTQFSSESLHRHIFMTYRFDNFSKDFVTILSAQQTLESRDWYQGTADAVRQNLHFLEDRSDLILILSGDHLYRMDYRSFIEFHLRKKAEISVAVTPVRSDQAPEFGVMKASRNGRIMRFYEKPRDRAILEDLRVPEDVFQHFRVEAGGRTHLASMGVYLFNLNVLMELLMDSGFKDFGREVIPAAIKRRRVFSYFFDGYWKDIGTIPSFFEAHLDLVRPSPRFNFYDEDKPIFTHARFLPGCKVLASEVRNSILCEGSVINRSTIHDSIVGIRSQIGKDCTIERTVLMGADFYETEEEKERNAAAGAPNVGIGRGSKLRNAIIDKNARIGPHVRLINKRRIEDEVTDNFVIAQGIIVVPKKAVIPEGTVI